MVNAGTYLQASFSRFCSLCKDLDDEAYPVQHRHAASQRRGRVSWASNPIAWTQVQSHEHQFRLPAG